MKNKDLFEGFEYSGISWNNRIAMAPMTRSRAIGNVPNELIATYYAQRATAGLLVSEGVAPSPDALGYPRIPGLFSQEQVAGWKLVTDAVHEAGAKIFAQLMHTGRVGHSANMPEGARIVAPSAISAEGPMWTDSMGMQQTEMPEEMTAADIQKAIGEFVSAAENAIAAGFDGVELHGANGYLLEQFLNPHTNKRSDAYGGSVENHSRFVLEVTRAVAAAIGKDKTGIRLSPYNTFNAMGAYEDTPELYGYLSKELDKEGILYLHLIDRSARGSAEGEALIKEIRNNFGRLLILNGGYNKERAQHALENEGADMISFGVPFIANPDLPLRMEQDIALSTPDSNTFYTADAKGYTDYAFSDAAN